MNMSILIQGVTEYWCVCGHGQLDFKVGIYWQTARQLNTICTSTKSTHIILSKSVHNFLNTALTARSSSAHLSVVFRR